MRTMLCCVLLAVVLTGCPPEPSTPPANLVKLERFVNPNNPCLAPIPSNPTLDPNSSDYIAHMAEVTTSVNWWTAGWSVPIFYADMYSAPTTKDVNIQNVHIFHGQRIPSWTRGCPESDGHALVVNLVEGCVAHYWGYNTGMWNWYPSAFSATAMPIDFDGTGRAQAGLPSRAVGTASGIKGGGVWPDELTSVIPRAQKFVIPDRHNRPYYVDPANGTDGLGTCQWDMAQGFHIQMNPSYDVSSLYTFEQVYAQCLKTYGAFLGDSNSGPLSFSGPPSKLSCTNNFFADMFPDCPSNETADVIHLRYDKTQFRLLAHGAYQSAPRDAYSTYCGTYDNEPAVLPVPTLSSISPSTALAGTTVTLTGTGLGGTYRVLFGSEQNCVWYPTVVSDTQVLCVVPVGSGTVAASIKTGGGQSGTVNFTYSDGGTPPTLSAISPSSGTTAGGTACTLTGTYLTGCTGVSFSGTAASGISVVSSTQVRCTSPARSAGGVTVTATTASGTSNGVAYTFVAVPTLSAINPTFGAMAGGTACTLTGTNLTGCSSVSFGGTAASGIVVDSSTQVRCTSPAKSEGICDVTATTVGGTSNPVNYTYTSGGPSYTATLYSPHDAYVLSSSSNKNYGASNLVLQKNATKEWADYIKFDLNSIQGTAITSATLRLYYWTTATYVAKVYSSTVNDGWSESTITWANKPAWGTLQASFTLPSNNWVEIEITNYVNSQFNGDKLVTMVIRDDQTQNINAQAFSDETSDTKRPELVIISQ